MSDERLRELERRWGASRALEDEVPLLVERVRCGHVTVPRARLAADLGQPAARELLVRLCEPHQEPAPDSPDVHALAELLRTACTDVQVGVRAGLALLRLALGLLAPRAPWLASLCQPAIDASEAWARCPCAEHARRAWTVARESEARADAADAAAQVVTTGEWWPRQGVMTADLLPGAIALAAGLPEPLPADPMGPDPTPLLVSVCEEYMSAPYGARTHEEVRGALLDQLVPWLLGHPDPLGVTSSR